MVPVVVVNVILYGNTYAKQRKVFELVYGLYEWICYLLNTVLTSNNLKPKLNNLLAANIHLYPMACNTAL